MFTDVIFTFDCQLLDVFSSEDHLFSGGEGDGEKREEREAETAEARETMDQWSRAYASHGTHKPHHFIGSISEIIKKLPEGLQISRVGQKINTVFIPTKNHHDLNFCVILWKSINWTLHLLGISL